ncbi:MAG: crossover junction endodeoxyribonuclease RuvC, partial [Clostridia bacterium]|nr:crossover junction endodeoxyribonuclease RuvC [Clostridia bacterium]
MRIMGIDPGLAIVGYGVIEYKAPSFKTIAYGAVTTPAHTEIPDRLNEIFNRVSELIDIYRPDDIAIEELFFNTNITTGISVAEARGVILLLFAFTMWFTGGIIPTYMVVQKLGIIDTRWAILLPTAV